MGTLSTRSSLYTHILQSDDVGMLAVAQEDFHLVRRIPFGFIDDLVMKMKSSTQRYNEVMT